MKKKLIQKILEKSIGDLKKLKFKNFEKLKNQGELFTYLSLILAITHIHTGTLIAKAAIIGISKFFK